MTGNLQLNDQLLSVAATATEMAKRLQLPKLDTTASGLSTTLTNGVDTPAQLDEALDENAVVQIVVQKPAETQERPFEDGFPCSPWPEDTAWHRFALVFEMFVGPWRPHTAWHPSPWM